MGGPLNGSVKVWQPDLARGKVASSMRGGLVRQQRCLALASCALLACGWASIGDSVPYACAEDGSCPPGRVCKYVEYGDGLLACVRPGAKAVVDGGVTDADGGIVVTRDGSVVVVDDGGRAADAGLTGPSPGTDAGRDAGAPDASMLDSGQPDAGPPDAGPPDAGPRDAGPVVCASLAWDFDGGVALRGYPADFQNYNVLFTTQALFAGRNIGGTSGADVICRTIAQAAGFWSPQTFVAFLSPFDATGASRFTANAGFVRSDGLPIAPSLAALLEGTLWYPPAATEHRRAIDAGALTAAQSSHVLTGVHAQSTGGYQSGQDCGGWAGSDGGTEFDFGDAFSTGRGWLGRYNTFGGCTSTAGRLYCAQLAGVCSPLAPERPPGARLAVLGPTVRREGTGNFFIRGVWRGHAPLKK